jgi:hypothetical protein
MTDLNGERKVHEAVGRFLCIFSELEHELGEAVKVIFKVQDQEAADAIGALADFTKKVNLVKSAVDFARRSSGEELSGEWKKSAQATLNAILAVNTKERVLLVHSRLQPQTDGSVVITRLTAQGTLKIDKKTWTQEDFRKKYTQIEDLINEVRAITKELLTVLLYAQGIATLSTSLGTPSIQQNHILPDARSIP